MARSFNFYAETTPTIGYKFRSKQQEQTAKHYKVERVLEFRYTFELPNYILEAAERAGYKAVQIGYTTRKSSTWGFYTPSVVKPKWKTVKALPAKGGYILELDDGFRPKSGHVFTTRKEAYEECKKLYPPDSIYKGEKIHNGYRFRIYKY